MKTLAVISVLSFIMMMNTSESLGYLFFLSLIAFVCSTIELTSRLDKKEK